MRAIAYRLAQLVYAMAPAYVANMTPPFVKYWPWWNRPINRDVLGAHKTVIGFVAGVIVAIATVYLQHCAKWPGWLVRNDHWLAVGLLFGVGAMGGDAIKSAIKRRMGIPPGARWIPADQVDFVIGAIVLVWPFTAFSWLDVIAILGISFAGHVAVDHVAYWLGIRDSKW